jgi:hypothetical protein
MINDGPLNRLSQLRVQFAGLALVLSACGGGGGGSAPTPPPSGPPPVGCAVERAVIEVAPGARAGHNVELALRSCTAAPLVSYEWRQTSGPAIPNMLSRKSAAMSVELPNTAGIYGFAVTYVDETGASRTANVNVDAAASSSIGVVMRGDPAVWGFSTMSVRAWLPAFTAADQAAAP